MLQKGHVRSGQMYECWITGGFSTWEDTGDFGDFSGIVEKRLPWDEG